MKLSNLANINNVEFARLFLVRIRIYVHVLLIEIRLLSIKPVSLYCIGYAAFYYI